jgi:hypothetical protein
LLVGTHDLLHGVPGRCARAEPWPPSRIREDLAEKSPDGTDGVRPAAPWLTMLCLVAPLANYLFPHRDQSAGAATKQRKTLYIVSWAKTKKNNKKHKNTLKKENKKDRKKKKKKNN